MCVFCKIVKGEIPSYKIYENDDVLAFLDIAQLTNGHTLIIPKKHYENIFALDEDISAKLLQATAVVARMLQQKLNINDLNLINNNGAKAGQEVNHYHLHLLPRYDGDNVKFSFQKKEINHENLKAIQQKILGN